MSTVLDIERVDISNDHLNRVVVTHTNLFHEIVNYNVANEVASIISDDEENGVDIPYFNENADIYEIYGETLKKIVDKFNITLNGEEVTPNQLYRLEFTC